MSDPLNLTRAMQQRDSSWMLILPDVIEDPWMRLARQSGFAIFCCFEVLKVNIHLFQKKKKWIFTELKQSASIAVYEILFLKC